MQIIRSGSQPSGKGPADFFTGSVRIDPYFNAPAPARVGCASVTFEPGARTAWHTHPLGQVLIVTAGCGWTQCEGGRHRHGARSVHPGNPLRTGVGGQRPGQARPQPHHRGRARGAIPHQRAPVSLEVRAAERGDPRRARRAHHPSGVLHGVAQRQYRCGHRAARICRKHLSSHRFSRRRMCDPSGGWPAPVL